MIITTRDGREYDTDRELTAAERHVVQKLMNWRDLAKSEAQFADKRAQALAAGWNGSGPVSPGPALAAILGLLEDQLRARLRGEGGG